MTSTSPQRTDATIQYDIDLGQHRLLLLSDQSLSLMGSAEAYSGSETILNLDTCEAYRLMISLQEMFKARSE